MVNLSPAAESYYESLSAMKFASLVNKCELGKAKQQIEESSVTHDRPQSLNLRRSDRSSVLSRGTNAVKRLPFKTSRIRL